MIGGYILRTFEKHGPIFRFYLSQQKISLMNQDENSAQIQLNFKPAMHK
jgi:hypothetical protein